MSRPAADTALGSPAMRGTIAATLMLALTATHVLRLALLPTGDPCAAPGEVIALDVNASASNVEQFTRDERPDLLQWTEGAFRNVDGTEQKLRFRVIRTGDLAPFFGPPLLFLPLTATEGDTRSLELIDVAGDELPVHLRSSKWSRNTFLAAYLYLLGDEPVARPAFTALGRALANPFGRPEVMTLLTAASEGEPAGSLRGRREPVLRWMTGAARDVIRACGG